jgi:hypothetical protein
MIVKQTRIISGIIDFPVQMLNEGEGLKIGNEILSESIQDLSGKQVSVRFYISEFEKTEEEMWANCILAITGTLDASHHAGWSEDKGSPWTDEAILIGGHDLRKEIYAYNGKFAYVEIDID